MSEPVDLAALEMAFAKEPASDAFIPLSTAYLEQGRFMEAMVVCKKGIRSQPDNIQGRILLAKVYAGQGKVPKAIDEIQKAIDQDQSVAEAHFVLGQLHERAGRFEESIEAFKAALEQDRDFSAAKDALAEKGVEVDLGPSPEELEAQRQAEQAAAEAARQQAAAEEARQVQMALSQSAASGPAGAGPAPTMGGRTVSQPGFAIPPTTSGSMNPGGVEVSQPYFLSQMETAAPGRSGGSLSRLGFTFGLGVLLLVIVGGLIFGLRAHKASQEEIKVVWDEGKLPFAKGTTRGLEFSAEKYAAVLRIDEEHPESAARRAYALTLLLYERGRRDVDDKAKEALAVAEKVAKKEGPTRAAQVYRKLYEGQIDEAIADVAKVDAETGSARLLSAKVQALIRGGKVGEIAPYLAVLEKADNPTILAQVGHAYRRIGEYDKARAALDGALRLEADHDPARAERALLILETKDLANLNVAYGDVSHLIDLGKTNVGTTQRGYAILGRAEVERLANKEDEASRDFETAAKELFKDPQVMYFNARWLAQKGADDKVLEALDKATNIDPYRVSLWEAYIEELIDQKKYDDADTALQKAQAIFPDHVQLLHGEVQFIAKKKGLKAAEKHLRDRLAKDDQPEVHRELADVLYDKGEFDEAIKVLQDAAEKAKSASKLTKASIYTMTGKVHARTKDYDAAIEVLKKSIEVSPSYAPAYYWLGYALKSNDNDAAAKEAFNQAAKLDPSSRMGKRARKFADKI